MRMHLRSILLQTNTVQMYCTNVMYNVEIFVSNSDISFSTFYKGYNIKQYGFFAG